MLCAPGFHRLYSEMTVCPRGYSKLTAQNHGFKAYSYGLGFRGLGFRGISSSRSSTSRRRRRRRRRRRSRSRSQS